MAKVKADLVGPKKVDSFPRTPLTQCSWVVKDQRYLQKSTQEIYPTQLTIYKIGSITLV